MIIEKINEYPTIGRLILFLKLTPLMKNAENERLDNNIGITL